MKRKVILKTVISIILIILLVGIVGIGYNKATENNQYNINEKNLEIPIFLYHHIVDNKSEIEYDYMQTTKDTFEKQIVGLENSGYHFISYDDLIQYKEGKKSLYKKSALLTFDDGAEDIYKIAYPILKKHNIPFTMFIITDYVGSDTYITWEEAREIQDSGLGLIASHSQKHEDFSKLSVEQAIENVNNSYKTIEENLGEQKTKIFTYPYGLYREDQSEALEKEGYIINLTDNKINKSRDLNLYGLHRCYPLSDSIFKMKLKIMYRSIRY